MNAASRMFLSWMLGGFTAFYAEGDFWISASLLGVFVIWFALAITDPPAEEGKDV